MIYSVHTKRHTKTLLATQWAQCRRRFEQVVRWGQIVRRNHSEGKLACFIRCICKTWSTLPLSSSLSAHTEEHIRNTSFFDQGEKYYRLDYTTPRLTWPLLASPGQLWPSYGSHLGLITVESSACSRGEAQGLITHLKYHKNWQQQQHFRVLHLLSCSTRHVIRTNWHKKHVASNSQMQLHNM